MKPEDLENMEIYNPPNQFKIKELWAFVSSDEGGEGLISVPFGNTMMPLIGADLTRVEEVRAFAIKAGELTGKKIKLMRFKLQSVENL